MDSEILTFLVEYRLQIIILLFLAWGVWAFFYIRKKKRVAPVFASTPTFPAVTPPERRITATEAELKRLAKENERLTLALAEQERKNLQKQIERTAEKKIQAMLPEKLWLLNPENQPVGRPIFYVGGVPCVDKKAEIERIKDESATFRLLDKLAPALTYKLIDWVFFKGETLFFYSAQLLPDGAWAITALSKPPKKTRRYLKTPYFAKPYVLLTGKQQTIDDLIANRWEVTKAKAAIHLTATVLGPFPFELYGKHKTSAGWEIYGGGTEEKPS